MARVSSFWKKIGNTIEPVFAGGVNILLRGTNRYINFGSVDEVDGYGFRDNGGVIEYKSSGGSWAAVGSGGGGLPDQTGNNGKFLTTDGTDPSWATLAGGGDMAAAVYDPVGGAEQVAFASDLGTAAAANTGDFATAAQGATADTATQPGDNISTLVNDAGYITTQSDDQTAAEVPFTPAGDIVATDVQAAIEELDGEKLGVDALNANLILYPTTTASDIGGYVKLASNIADPDYDATAVNVSTGAITTTSQLISSLASEAGIIEGELGVLNNTVIGNIRRTAGSGTATFYFEVYKRSSGGTETLLETSANTLPVSSGTYVQFSAAGLINNGPFLLTDRIVLKFYGNRIAGGSDPTYDFQFGGDIPTRALFPLPLTAVPTDAHNELSGLQGGTTDEYYHLTAAEDTFLNDITATAAELNFVDGVTSNVQTQLNAKAPTASPTFTGDIQVGNLTVTSITGGATIAGSAGGAFNVTDQVYSNSISVSGNVTTTGNITATGNMSTTDLQVTGEFGADAEVDDGNSSTADTINWTTGNFHKSTMTGNCTYTFTAPTYVGRYQLMLVQDATGSRTATWPPSVKWAGGTPPTLSTAASSIDIITFYFDGTNFYGVDSLAFA